MAKKHAKRKQFKKISRPATTATTQPTPDLELTSVASPVAEAPTFTPSVPKTLNTQYQHSALAVMKELKNIGLIFGLLLVLLLAFWYASLHSSFNDQIKNSLTKVLHIQ